MKKTVSLILTAAVIALGLAANIRAQTTDASKYFAPNTQTYNTLVLASTTTLLNQSYSTGTVFGIIGTQTGTLYAIAISTGYGPGACEYVSFATNTVPMVGATAFKSPCIY